jgi:hypothetical protein
MELALMILSSMAALVSSTLTVPEQMPLIMSMMGDGSDKFKVAGSNPFYYCHDPDPYTLQIASINLIPSDPSRWQP